MKNFVHTAFFALCFLIVATLSLSFTCNGQDQKLDRLCLNLSNQEISLNERVPKRITFDSIPNSRQKTPDLSIEVEVLDSTYFYLSSWLLKPDTVTGSARPGRRITTGVYTGADYVLGNRLIIQNNSDTGTFVPIEDNNLVLIQEAKDSAGNWKPVEYFIHSFCGNSYSAFRIPSKMSFQCMIAKYCGDFKTQMRVRISLNHQVYFSEEFEGFINYSQLTTSSNILRESLFHSEAY